MTTRTLNGVSRGMAVAALLTSLGSMACHDILKVQDPQDFASSALSDQALWPALANGAEGDMQLQVADYAIFTGMLSDELWDSSTWIDWHNVSIGSIRPNLPNGTAGDGAQDGLLRARYSAQAAEGIFIAGMKDTVNTSPLFIQVKTVDAWADLMLAMGWCESPPTPGSATVSDTVMFKNALAKLTAVLALAQNGHYDKASDLAAQVSWINVGIARANQMLGNYDAALKAAQLVPAGFEKDAVYSTNSGSQNNDLFIQGNAGANRSYTIRGMWYSQIDTIAGYLKDWYSGQLDTRVPLTHDNGNVHGYALGAGGVVPFYSNGKATSKASPVAMAKYGEAVLIEAEASWKGGQFQAAVDQMNINRTAVGLPTLVLPSSGDVSSWVFNAILSERFAELFTEGFRMQDLYRFNLVTAKLGKGRLIKLPLSVTESVNNSNIRIGGGKCPGVS